MEGVSVMRNPLPSAGIVLHTGFRGICMAGPPRGIDIVHDGNIANRAAMSTAPRWPAVS
jgi:hypothetical protein